MRIAFFSEAFYYNLQESVLEKAVWFHWLFMQQKEIACMKNRASCGAKIKLAGDGQFDSPGELSPVLWAIADNSCSTILNWCSSGKFHELKN